MHRIHSYMANANLSYNHLVENLASDQLQSCQSLTTNWERRLVSWVRLFENKDEAEEA